MIRASGLNIAPPPHRSAKRWLALLQVPTLALALAACGDDGTEAGGISSSSSGSGGSGAGTTSSGTGGSGASTSSGSGGDAVGYPAPPYGNEVDDTFPMLAWEGWLNPSADQLATDGTYGPFDSDGIRTSGDDFALVHLAANY